MTLVVPPLSGAVAHDDPETLIGTLAPTGGAAPYEVIAIWPAGPANGFDPDRVALGIWRERESRPVAVWRGRDERPAASWRGRHTRPEANV